MSALYDPWRNRQRRGGRTRGLTLKAWREAMALAVLSSGQAMSVREIAYALDEDYDLVDAALRALAHRGHISAERCISAPHAPPANAWSIIGSAAP